MELVLLYGIGKGGLEGALGIIAIPMMALITSPIQAPTIILPVLCVMDIFAIKTHYRSTDYSLIKLMLPGALTGIFIAGLFLSMIPIVSVSLLIGSLSFLFCIQYVLNTNNIAFVEKAWFWCALGGLSSRTIHARKSISIYLLPKKLEKITLIATMVLSVFKLISYPV